MSDDELFDELTLAELDFTPEFQPDASLLDEDWKIIDLLREHARRVQENHSDEVGNDTVQMLADLDRFIAEGRGRGYNDMQIGVLILVRFAPTVTSLADRLMNGDIQAGQILKGVQMTGMEPFQVLGGHIVEALK